MLDFSGHRWIKVKHFKFDPTKSWEENYKALEAHHVEETTFLIDKIREVASTVNEAQSCTTATDRCSGMGG